MNTYITFKAGLIYLHTTCLRPYAHKSINFVGNSVKSLPTVFIEIRISYCHKFISVTQLDHQINLTDK